MRAVYCPECGTKLIEKNLEGEGKIPYCPTCPAYRFPRFNVAVSMIVVNEENGKILLIQQYGRRYYILVAGYVNEGEQLEHAAERELKEETGMKAVRIHFNRSKYYEPSDTLMCNFTVYVRDDRELHPNEEIDSCSWFSPGEARRNIKENSLAAEFLNAWLDEK